MTPHAPATKIDFLHNLFTWGNFFFFFFFEISPEKEKKKKKEKEKDFQISIFQKKRWSNLHPGVEGRTRERERREGEVKEFGCFVFNEKIKKNILEDFARGQHQPHKKNKQRNEKRKTFLLPLL